MDKHIKGPPCDKLHSEGGGFGDSVSHIPPCVRYKPRHTVVLAGAITDQVVSIYSLPGGVDHAHLVSAFKVRMVLSYTLS